MGNELTPIKANWDVVVDVAKSTNWDISPFKKGDILEDVNAKCTLLKEAQAKPHDALDTGEMWDGCALLQLDEAGTLTYDAITAARTCVKDICEAEMGPRVLLPLYQLHKSAKGEFEFGMGINEEKAAGYCKEYKENIQKDTRRGKKEAKKATGFICRHRTLLSESQSGASKVSQDCLKDICRMEGMDPEQLAKTKEAWKQVIEAATTRVFTFTSDEEVDAQCKQLSKEKREDARLNRLLPYVCKQIVGTATLSGTAGHAQECLSKMCAEADISSLAVDPLEAYHKLFETATSTLPSESVEAVRAYCVVAKMQKETLATSEEFANNCARDVASGTGALTGGTVSDATAGAKQCLRDLCAPSGAAPAEPQPEEKAPAAKAPPAVTAREGASEDVTKVEARVRPSAKETEKTPSIYLPLGVLGVLLFLCIGVVAFASQKPRHRPRAKGATLSAEAIPSDEDYDSFSNIV